METLIQVATGWILPALFFWFLFSIAAMIIIDIIQWFMKSRQRFLEDAIQKLLGNEYKNKFYEHALVNPLEENKPSYISSSLFAKVVMEWMLTETEIEKPARKGVVETSASPFIVVLEWILKKIQPTKSEVKETLFKTFQRNIDFISQNARDAEFVEVLKNIVAQADLKTDNDSEFLDLIQKDLEAWFDETVNQISSEYGKRLQYLTGFVSLVVAFITNFDLIDMTSRLWETSKYSEFLALLEKAKQYQYIPIDRNQFLKLPIWWDFSSLPNSLTGWVLKIVGIGLGAFFIAIGSQYVYNLRKKQYKPSE